MNSKTTGRWTLASASLVCVAMAALLASPSPPTRSVAGAADSVVTATPSGVRSPVAVSDVVMVMNDDGSATLSATFAGLGDVVALKSVHIESDAGALEVASTQMWLPILPGTKSRAGDASDAGGFVVPSGLAPDQIIHLQFQFDNDTCLTINAQTVRRNPTHDEVFPTNGKQLGPGKQTTANAECSRASDALDF